jgi:hypothetical protein
MGYFESHSVSSGEAMITPSESRALAQLARTLNNDELIKLIRLYESNAHLAEYPSAWQDYIKARLEQ